jgi:hypothetical protein
MWGFEYPHPEGDKARATKLSAKKRKEIAGKAA